MVYDRRRRSCAKCSAPHRPPLLSRLCIARKITVCLTPLLIRLMRVMRTFIILISTLAVAAAEWPAPKATVVSSADGYVEIPNAAWAPIKNSTYRAIFDSTRPADKPTELLPALTFTVAGTVAAAVLLLVRLTISPPVGKLANWSPGLRTPGRTGRS